MAIDATTVILTAMFTGIGVSIGNALFEAFFKDYFRKLKKHKEHLAMLRKKVLHFKRPWLAALLNFFVWGLGYWYVGKKRFLGILLFIIELFVVGGFSFGQSTLKSIFEGLSYSFLSVIIGLYLSFDAYKIAKDLDEGKYR
jgi:ABC-type proline/glycine betaine transport system permease subunit